MRRYEKYKDSGVEWIEEIPEHWEVGRFKQYYKFINNKCEKELPKIGLEHISSWTGQLIENDTEFEGDGSCFQIDDILFGKLRPYLAKVYLADFEGKAVGDFFVFRPESQIIPKFGHKFLLSRNFIEITNSSTFGSKMPRVSPDFISELKTLVPPSEEQTAIATYLDQKTAEIDTLITDKKRLLELYEEEKSAIINEAVTKGLASTGLASTRLASTRLASTSSAAFALGGVGSKKKKVLEKSEAGGCVLMKDSGIEWMGEIPAHWEVKRLKYVATLKSGEGIVSEQITERGEYPVYGGNGMRGYFSDFTHDGNFILIGRQGAYCGNIKYGQGKFWASEHAVVVKPIIEYEPYYLGELLRAMNLNQFSVSAAQPGLAVDNIKNLNIPIPPIEEQKEIVQYIEAETQRIDTKKVRTQKLIDLLTEYRTALISEVVTGKVKVV